MYVIQITRNLQLIHHSSLSPLHLAGFGMNNIFQVKELIETIPMLKSSRANYIFISDNGFIKRNGYFFKERIQIISMKWSVNIETYIQLLDYRKF